MKLQQWLLAAVCGVSMLGASPAARANDVTNVTSACTGFLLAGTVQFMTEPRQAGVPVYCQCIADRFTPADYVVLAALFRLDRDAAAKGQAFSRGNVPPALVRGADPYFAARAACLQTWAAAPRPPHTWAGQVAIAMLLLHRVTGKIDGKETTWLFATGGTVRSLQDGRLIDTGRWATEDLSLCLQFPGADKQCYSVEVTDDDVLIIDRTGGATRMKRARVDPGTP